MMTAGPALAVPEFERLRAAVQAACGIQLPPVKRTMVETRLRRRLRELQMDNFRAYCDYLETPRGRQDETTALVNAITTNKTDFFREPAHFRYLTAHTLPAWERHTGGRRVFRAWSAGCSSGEEPYTLAMVLSEYADARKPGAFRFEIWATDVSTRVLALAQRAVYPAALVEPVPLPLRRKYLLRRRAPAGGEVRVGPALRRTVQFDRLNFLDAHYRVPEPFDVIFCRNVLIYFDPDRKAAIVRRLAEHLRPGGWLMIGHSESLHGTGVPLAAAAPAIYRKEAS